MPDPTRKPDPPPDLPEFIRKHGGYAKVTPKAGASESGSRPSGRRETTTPPALLKIWMKAAGAKP